MHQFDLLETKGRGTIVNIASVTGHLPSPFLTAYSTSKYAVVGFTKGLQFELSHQKSPIKLILVSPGFADTPIIRTNEKFKLPKILEWMITRPETVAQNVLDAVISGKEEIFPGISAQALLALEKFTPNELWP